MKIAWRRIKRRVAASGNIIDDIVAKHDINALGSVALA